MHKFWYDYVKPKNAEAKLYYMNTDSFLANIKTKKNLGRHCTRCCIL